MTSAERFYTGIVSRVAPESALIRADGGGLPSVLPLRDSVGVPGKLQAWIKRSWREPPGSVSRTT